MQLAISNPSFGTQILNEKTIIQGIFSFLDEDSIISIIFFLYLCFKSLKKPRN